MFQALPRFDTVAKLQEMRYYILFLLFHCVSALTAPRDCKECLEACCFIGWRMDGPVAFYTSDDSYARILFFSISRDDKSAVYNATSCTLRPAGGECGGDC